MQVISNDIQFLEALVTWDISGTLPAITIQNLSEGTGLANVSYWFVATSPTGTLIHEGTEDSPDVTGIWTTETLSDSWPRPFNQIEWSGAPYQLVIYAKDGAGNIFSITKVASICRPNGNTPLSKNFYGISSTNVQLKCQEARIYFEDQTNHSYKGQDGTQVSSILKMVYPIDETGNIPTPFQISSFTIALVPISYSSDNYQFQTQSVYDYDFGDYVHIRIRYQTVDPKKGTAFITFPVLCNIDLCPLVCEYVKLIDSIENGTCSDVESANQKLSLINPKLLLAQIGMQQPLCGIDVPGLISEIEEIGGFQCDCCSAPTGIIPQTSSVVDGFTFSINPVCGDVNGTVTVTGNNIQFNLQDKSYVFNLSNTIPTTAFTVTPSTNGCVKTYSLNVNLTTLDTDILNSIKSDAGLVALFNSIVQFGGEFELLVDGGCIFQSTSAFDYTWDLLNIPVNTTYSILSGITKSGVVQALFFQFNITNLPALQTYLNSLGIGSFVVTNPSGQTVHIVSSANPNNLSALTYKISSTTFIATQSSTAAGYIALSANQVVQNIINYLCGLEDNQLVTSQLYNICYLDPTTKQKVTLPVASGTSLSGFITSLLAAGCNTVDYITSLGQLTCASIQSAFPQSVNSMGVSDFFLGTKNGLCARIFAVEAGTRILTLGSTDQDFVNAFCALVEQCGGGQVCAPYNIFQVGITPFDNTCPSIIDFSTSFTGSTLNINSITFSNTPLSAQTITIEYKLVTDSSYTLFSNSTMIDVNGIPTAPIGISLTAGQQYNIRLSDNCASPPVYDIQTITVPGGTNTVEVRNSLPFMNFSGVVGISGFAFVPSTGNTDQFGTHAGFTGFITVFWNATVPASPAFSVRLLKNGVVTACFNYPVGSSSTNFAFPSDTYLITDTILIDSGTGSC